MKPADAILYPPVRPSSARQADGFDGSHRLKHAAGRRVAQILSMKDHGKPVLHDHAVDNTQHSVLPDGAVPCCTDCRQPGELDVRYRRRNVAGAATSNVAQKLTKVFFGGSAGV